MTREDREARATAYDEAAEHLLLLHWTDNPAEVAQGNIVASVLRATAEMLRRKHVDK